MSGPACELIAQAQVLRRQAALLCDEAKALCRSAADAQRRARVVVDRMRGKVHTASAQGEGPLDGAMQDRTPEIR